MFGSSTSLRLVRVLHTTVRMKDAAWQGAAISNRGLERSDL